MPIHSASRRGEVVVDGDDVDALAFERVQVAGQRGDERFAFAGAHLGDRSLVQDHPADELHVVVAHAQDALAPLATDGERLVEDVVERRAVVELLFELGGLRLSSASLSLLMAGSSALIASTCGLSRRTSRSCEVPRIFFSAQVIMRVRSARAVPR